MPDFAIVTVETASDILAAHDIHPTHLTRDFEDNAFVATFDATPAPIMRSKIEAAHSAIVLVNPEVVEARVPNNDPQMPVTVRFGFTENPIT